MKVLSWDIGIVNLSYCITLYKNVGVLSKIHKKIALPDPAVIFPLSKVSDKI